MDATLVNFLSGILGDAKYPDREWVYFVCPFCLEQNKYKVKLAIHSNSYAWKCWVCQ
ncbi:MAG TPA: hypothetical protein P5301_00070 [Bacteroidales bacterium]|nr:hypothetical protein [Bacteroidales bacterium]HQL12176.1 hypothetical protein [bacterium]HRR51858.1 hypothetical protein [Bacteroidales bacterium]HRS68564.1 hypothetical protein [Bacteroidales bacterium]